MCTQYKIQGGGTNRGSGGGERQASWTPVPLEVLVLIEGKEGEGGYRPNRSLDPLEISVFVSVMELDRSWLDPN